MKITIPLYEVSFSRGLVYRSPDFRFTNFAEVFFLKIMKLKMFFSFFQQVSFQKLPQFQYYCQKKLSNKGRVVIELLLDCIIRLLKNIFFYSYIHLYNVHSVSVEQSLSCLFHVCLNVDQMMCVYLLMAYYFRTM